MSARQVEAYVKKVVSDKKNDEETDEYNNIAETKDDIAEKRDIEVMQGRLRNALGTKVKLDDNKGRGKIVIEYYSADERERILEYLLGTN